jgi:hypothetical protein
VVEPGRGSARTRAFADQDGNTFDPGALGRDQAPLSCDHGIGAVLRRLNGRWLDDARLAQARLKPGEE